MIIASMTNAANTGKPVYNTPIGPNTSPMTDAIHLLGFQFNPYP